MNSLTYEQVREMLLACTERIMRNEPYLTRADAAIGDGDHGTGMVIGMKAAREVLEKEADGDDIGKLYSDTAKAMETAMGGASGMIFSTMFAGNAKEGAPMQEMSTEDFAARMAEGLRAIQELGHAQPGDKTMVDALYPAVEALKSHVSESFEEMLDAAAKAAYEGMEASKKYVAKFGRAKNLMERAIGHQDAGASSTWLIFQEMADFIRGEKTPDPDPESIGEAKRGAELVSKKIINDPLEVVKECGEGFLAAYGDEYMAVPGVQGFVRRNIPDGKVALILGGGSGHEPMFGFFLGENLGDGAANGNIFASPDPVTIASIARAAHRGAGVLFVYGNYAGDVMNFDKAAEMLEAEGIKVRTVRNWDDVASAPMERRSDRRGIAGDVFIVKIAGGACAKLPLEEAVRVTEKARDSIYSVGVGIQGATLPGKKEPIFTLSPDEMEYGLGIHGEPGIKRVKMQTADEIVTELLDALLADSGIRAGDEVATYVNGLGSTTLMELMIMNRKLKMLLDEKGIKIHNMEVGSHVISQEMAGASISLMKLDEELKEYYDMPCRSPFYTR
ncbi:MAG: dihydroxyacetone kinase subunit L [Lachnospiraceae bacterium]|nr:dihydroxyacetone kinase subunit L [Lachnospiraceae bacterium]